MTWGSVISGDSMGNTEVIRRGDLQMTSAGTGIRHSEKCHGPKEVHFLQIWATPDKSKLTPKYYTRLVYPTTYCAMFLIGA
jgi:redox-sensitive bicupin YhaK (pirin superfamily)